MINWGVVPRILAMLQKSFLFGGVITIGIGLIGIWALSDRGDKSGAAGLENGGMKLLQEVQITGGKIVEL